MDNFYVFSNSKYDRNLALRLSKEYDLEHIFLYLNMHLLHLIFEINHCNDDYWLKGYYIKELDMLMPIHHCIKKRVWKESFYDKSNQFDFNSTNFSEGI